MNEASLLMKLLVLLGTMALVASLLAADGRGPGPITAWDDLTANMAAGVDFPTFENPFIRDFLVDSLGPDIGVGTFLGTERGQGPYTEPPTVGCAQATYWNCLISNDGNDSYVSVGATPGGGGCVDGDLCPDLAINMTGQTSSQFAVTQVVVSIWCRGIDPLDPDNDPVNDAIFLIDDNRDTAGQYATALHGQALLCPVSSGFEKVSLALRYQGDPNMRVDDDGAEVGECATFPPTPCTDSAIGTFNVRMYLRDSFREVQITAIQVDIYSNNQPPCTGGFLETTGCQIARFFFGVIDGIRFVINAFVFVIASFLSIVAFIGGIIIGFFAGIISVAGFFLSLPDTPAPVQAVFTVGFLAVIGAILFIIVSIVRGR